MAEENLKSASEIRIQDPLSDVTRKERKMLLIVSTLGWVIIKVGLLPEKINALGIDFSMSNKMALLSFTAFVILYFILAFAFYAISDFVSWRIQFNATRLRLYNKMEDGDKVNSTSNYPALGKKLHLWTRLSIPVSFIRSILEFLFPIIFGSIIFFYLLFHQPS